MKKRLRKKLRLGEWEEVGLKITFTATPCAKDADCADCDALLDRFIDAWSVFPLDAWGTGNGWVPGDERTWETYLFATERYASVTEPQKAHLEAWLKQEPEIVAFTVGPFIDRNHSPDWMGCGEGSRYWGRIAKRTPRT